MYVSRFFTMIAFQSVLLSTLLVCTELVAHGDNDTDIVVLNADQIEKWNVLQITDLLNQVPGVRAGESSVAIRGSYKVRVMLDGRPINDLTSSYSAINWGLISLPNVERIEIRKGQGGMEYGDDSSGGVILVTTKKIRELNGSVELYAGNLETWNCQANAQQRFKKSGIGVSGGFYTSDGYITNNDKRKRRLGLNMDYELFDDCEFCLSADYLDIDQGYSGLPQFPTPNSRNHRDTFSSLLVTKIRNVKSKTYYTVAENHNTDTSRNLDALIRVYNIGEDINAAIPLGRLGDLNTGLGAERTRAEGNRFDPQQETKAWIYGFKDFPCERIPLTINGGLRLAFYSEFESTYNPELKLRYKLEPCTFQFTAGRINNTPSFLQRYNETAMTKPNPDLDIETADNYMMTASSSLTPDVSGSATLFYSEIRDRITYVRDDFGEGRYTNFGKVTYKGAELSLSWKVLKELSLSGSYTYLEAKDEETGNWLAAKSRHVIKGNATYNPMDKLSVVLYAKYHSGAYSRNTNTEWSPGYYVADMRTEYAIGSFRIFAEIKNLLNRDYCYGEGYQAPPQTWVAGTSCSF